MPELDFSKENSLYATHGLHSYAAKCPPHLVKYGLRYFSKPGERVLDPMVGSGNHSRRSTFDGRHAVGYDIDRLKDLDISCSILEKLSVDSPSRAKLIQRYFVDMDNVMRRISSILKQRRHAIIVVCPSHIRKITVPTHEVLAEMVVLLVLVITGIMDLDRPRRGLVNVAQTSMIRLPSSLLRLSF